MARMSTRERQVSRPPEHLVNSIEAIRKRARRAVPRGAERKDNDNGIAYVNSEAATPIKGKEPKKEQSRAQSSKNRDKKRVSESHTLSLEQSGGCAHGSILDSDAAAIQACLNVMASLPEEKGIVDATVKALVKYRIPSASEPLHSLGDDIESWVANHMAPYNHDLPTISRVVALLQRAEATEIANWLRQKIKSQEVLFAVGGNLTNIAAQAKGTGAFASASLSESGQRHEEGHEQRWNAPGKGNAPLAYTNPKRRV